MDCMPWKVDIFVRILHLRKGRLSEIKERPMIMQVVPGRIQDSKTQIFIYFTLSAVFSFSLYPFGI